LSEINKVILSLKSIKLPVLRDGQSKKELFMKNTFRFAGILAIMLIFGVFVAGCATSSNFYNLGIVPEDHYALIRVSPIVDAGNDWPFINLVKINGQGDSELWKSTGANNAVVRVAPGEYTFTISFVRTLTDVFTGQVNSINEFPVDITYNVLAGKGYYFHFSTTIELNYDSIDGRKEPFSITNAKITLLESDYDEKENFGDLLSSTLRFLGKVKEVATRTVRWDLRSLNPRGSNVIL